MDILVILAVVLGALILVASFFLRFTYVEEGTAKAVKRFSGFRKIIMKWEGYTLAEGGLEDGDVVQGEDPWSIVGGLRFVGIRFIDEIHEYKFRWRGIQLVGGKEEVKFEEKTINYILVRPDVYATDIEKAETRPPERIPLNVRFLVTMRVLNPEKALFKAPSNWFENVMTKLNALLRTWVSNLTLDDILRLKKSTQKIWNGGFTVKNEDGQDIIIDGIKDDPLLEMFKSKWGVVIEDNGIEIRDVDPPSDIQDAAEAERKQELISKGFAAKTTIRLAEMIAGLQGTKLKEVQDEFKTDLKSALKKYKRVLVTNLDLVKRELGLGAGIQEFHVSSPEGLITMLASILRGGGPGRGNNPGGANSTSNGGRREEDDDDDDDNDGWGDVR